MTVACKFYARWFGVFYNYEEYNPEGRIRRGKPWI